MNSPVMNTLQSAAALARTLAEDGVRTHLSTALTPSHRERVLSETGKLLAPENCDAHGIQHECTECWPAVQIWSFEASAGCQASCNREPVDSRLRPYISRVS